MAFGVTDAGFIKPTEAEIESQLVDDFRAEFGSLVILSPETFLGQQLAIIKKRLVEFWDYMEGIYYTRFGSTSTGVNMDRALFPFLRLDAIKASTVLEFTGDEDSVILAGSLAQTADGVNFETIADAIIESGGIVLVDAICTQTGIIGNRPVGTITELPVTISGVDSVTNTTPATGGAEVEEDPEFLARVQEESQVAKSSSIPAIKAAIRALSGINQINIIENDTDATVDGIPPNTLHIIVRGSATDLEVATAIFGVIAGGIGTFGTTEVIITNGEDTYPTRFSRSVTVNVYVDYVVTVNTEWVEDNIAIIKARCLEYIGGVDPFNVEFEGVAPGEDVMNWKCIACLFNLGRLDDLGILDVSVTLSREVDPSTGETENIEILSTEEAVTDYSFITVTVQE
jgi:hypothetical protein